MQAINRQSAAHTHRVMLPALCWNRARPDFYAVTEDVSTAGIRLRSAVVPAVGERLSCSVRYLGLMEAQVVDEAGAAFVIRPLVPASQNAEIVRDLLRFGRQQEASNEPHRVHQRIVPQQCHTQVTLPNGATLPATIVNLSASGAALRIDEPIEIGTSITIGTTNATVVRTFANGFGAVFPVLIDPTSIDAHIRL